MLKTYSVDVSEDILDLLICELDCEFLDAELEVVEGKNASAVYVKIPKSLYYLVKLFINSPPEIHYCLICLVFLFFQLIVCFSLKSASNWVYLLFNVELQLMSEELIAVEIKKLLKVMEPNDALIGQ